jgi:transcriptional repressor NrdR
MKCPYCGYYETKVVDSRPAEERNAIRRRRECNSCGKRFTTYEKVESIPLMVVKKDGRRGVFTPQISTLFICIGRPSPPVGLTF